MKRTKLLQEVDRIVNSDANFWAKAKALVSLDIGSRPGCNEARAEIDDFLKTGCRHPERFRTAYVRPYLPGRHYSHYKEDYLPCGGPVSIGMEPRGITVRHVRSKWDRVKNYFQKKYPDAFLESEELVDGERQKVFAWNSVLGGNDGYIYRPGGPWKTLQLRFREIEPHNKYLRRIPRDTQLLIRDLDMKLDEARTDYQILKKQSGLPPKYLRHETGLGELQTERCPHSYAVFMGWYITVETDIEFIELGPWKTTSNHQYRVTGRRIVDRKPGECHRIGLDSYSGNFLMNTLFGHFNLKRKKIKVSDELKPVQLSPWLGVREINLSDRLPFEPGMTHDGIAEYFGNGPFKYYERIFQGHHWDYCVMRDGCTYHGRDIRSCLDGWAKKSGLDDAKEKEHAKIAKSEAKKKAKETKSKLDKGILDFGVARHLGFCKTGIQEFCDDNGLDIDRTYQVDELEKIVLGNIGKNRKYRWELKRIGIQIG